MKVASIRISADYIEQRFNKLIEIFNELKDGNKKDEIAWDIEFLLDFFRDAGVGVKIYENTEGDKLEFGYIYEL